MKASRLRCLASFSRRSCSTEQAQAEQERRDKETKQRRRDAFMAAPKPTVVGRE